MDVLRRNRRGRTATTPTAVPFDERSKEDSNSVRQRHGHQGTDELDEGDEPRVGRQSFGDGEPDPDEYRHGDGRCDELANEDPGQSSAVRDAPFVKVCFVAATTTAAGLLRRLPASAGGPGVVRRIVAVDAADDEILVSRRDLVVLSFDLSDNDREEEHDGGYDGEDDCLGDVDPVGRVGDEPVGESQR